MFVAGVVIGVILQICWGWYVYRLMDRGVNFRDPIIILGAILIHAFVLGGTILYDVMLTLGVLIGDIAAGVLVGLYLRIRT